MTVLHATLVGISLLAAPQAVEPVHVLPLRERAAWIDATLARRLDTLVPALMRREGIDLWIVSAREYDEG